MGFAQGVRDAQIKALEWEVEDSAIKLADNLDQFGERENIEQ